MSLRQVSPDLNFWSDASDVGWGAHLGPLVASSLWDLEQASLSINARELLAIQHGLLHFQSSLSGQTVAVFCDNVTAVAYLRKEGGTRSLLNNIAQRILRWFGVSSHPSGSSIHPGLQQRPGGRSVSPSPAAAFRVVPQHDHVLVFVSSVASADRFACDLRKSPLLDLFFSLPRPSVCGHGCLPPVLGQSSGLRLSSVCHHSQSPCETPGVSGDGAHPCGSALGTAPLVFGPPPAVTGPSGHPPRSCRPPAPASISALLPGSPQATASCLETLRRFTRDAGFSSAVAEQSSLARRPSLRAVYQLQWSVYRSWCYSHGHSVSRPSLEKMADFLSWLRSARGLSFSSIRGYRSMLSAVFRFHLPFLSSDPVLRDLLRSFKLSSAERVLRPPAWDLSRVLRFLNSSHFEPLSQASLRALSQKTLFLLALATAK